MEVPYIDIHIYIYIYIMHIIAHIYIHVTIIYYFKKRCNLKDHDVEPRCYHDLAFRWVGELPAPPKDLEGQVCNVHFAPVE